MKYNKNDIKMIKQYPNSNRALHLEHMKWVPKYKNPFNIILTFANDISEQFARDKYGLFVRNKISKRILNNANRRNFKIIEQRGYLEYGSNGRYHIHAMLDVYSNWSDRFADLVHSSWVHGLVIEIKKIPIADIFNTHSYNSKMRTKKTESGHYSDSLLVV